MEYDCQKAVAYAREWAYKRNPKYHNFDKIGGDCTNFISQCLYSGCEMMDYTRDIGWYYASLNDRAPAWTGVTFLHRYLTAPNRRGPYAVETSLTLAREGDIVQLSFDGEHYAHSLLVVGESREGLLIATHSDDTFNRPLSSYLYKKCRLLQIVGVNG